MNIAVIDYGVGNVRSIMSAFDYLGASVMLTNDENFIYKSDGIVLPGVGSFSHGMDKLDSYALIDVIKRNALQNKPLLGICLGMQLLFDKSEEFGSYEGLGLIAGNVLKFPTQNMKLPHMGWSELYNAGELWSGTVLDGIKEGGEVYFAHSFIAYPDSQNNVLSTSQYLDYKFCSSVMSGNIFGCQFHPEKSGRTGLNIISNFIGICQK